MLEYIRSSAQSFGVKIAFGVIILVFVFWGIGNYNDRDYSNVVAVVNGEPIVALQFEKAYRDAEEYILRSNPGMTREQLAGMHLGRQVLNDLIQLALLSQEAARAGIEASPLELRLAVNGVKAFQNEQGRFDPEAYRRVLAAQRMTPAEYEKNLAGEIIREKILSLVTAPVWIDPAEALNRYNFLRERRVIDYIFLPAAQYGEGVKVSEGEIKDWYDAHKADFAVLPQVDVEYVAVSPAALVDPASVDEASVRAWYEGHKSDFETPERVRASHILVPLAEDADENARKEASAKIGEVKAALASGKTFAAVADEFNQEGATGPGGSLGWISRGQTVPAFEEAAFALEPGAVSDVVTSPFGLHIIYVEEKDKGGLKPFEEVEEEARKTLAEDDGQDKIHEVLDALIEDNILKKPLDASAEKFGLKAQSTGLLDKNGLMEKLGVNAAGADSLLALPAGVQMDTALEAGSEYIVCRVTAATPASVKPLADVQGEIANRLKTEKALREAMGAAEKLLAEVKDQPVDKLEADKLNIKVSEPIERGAPVPGFEPDATLNEAIFAAKNEQWLPGAYAEREKDAPGALIARVAKILPPEPGEFETVEAIMTRSADQERKNGIFALFMNNLAQNAEVEIINQNLVDRVNM